MHKYETFFREGRASVEANTYDRAITRILCNSIEYIKSQQAFKDEGSVDRVDISVCPAILDRARSPTRLRNYASVNLFPVMISKNMVIRYDLAVFYRA